MYISASAPEAPPLSETTIGCFIRLFFWMAACIILAIWSDAPPAPAATTISTGLLGSHANAGAVVSASAASALGKKPISLLTSFPPFRFPTARLSGPARRCLGAVRKIFHRRANTLSLYWNAGKRQAHFHAGQRAHQGEVVEVAEMADAEHLATELAEAGAERHVKGLENDLAYVVRVMAGGYQHCGERSGVLARIERKHFQTPGADGAARRLRMALVPREDRVEALFVEQHAERFAQAVEQIGRRRIGEIAGLAVGDHIVPRPVAARQARGFGGGQRLGRDAVERQPRRQHQPLLRAGYRDIDAPFVVPVVDRSERRNRVDHVKGRMAGGIDGAAHVADAGCNPG